MARAWADVSLDAVRHNVVELRQIVAPAALCAVVKADGYGHGAAPVARAALDAGATWLAVAHVAEAAALRADGIDAAILLLSEPTEDQVHHAVRLDLHITAYTKELIARLGAAAEATGATVPVHLKVDTGMHRVGARPEDVVALASAIDEHGALELRALWTHCAVADEPGDPFTAEQLARFDAAVEAVRAAGIEVPLRHAANSAAALAHPLSLIHI